MQIAEILNLVSMQLFLTCVSLEVPHQLRLLSGLGIQGLERVGNMGNVGG